MTELIFNDVSNIDIGILLRELNGKTSLTTTNLQIYGIVVAENLF